MSFKYEKICQAQNSLKQNHKICYRYDHTGCCSKPQKVIKQNRPQKVLEGRPHHKKWGILINFMGTAEGCPFCFEKCFYGGLFDAYLKNECINLYEFKTEEALYKAVADFAYVEYNYARPHSYNNYATPHEGRIAS